jgi:hypothetical protein
MPNFLLSVTIDTIVFSYPEDVSNSELQYAKSHSVSQNRQAVSETEAACRK